MTILSVDCGKREIWSAEWEADGLVALDHQTFEFYFQIHIPARMRVTVVEEMQIYQGAANSKGADAEDLLQVQKTVGAVLAKAAGRTLVYKPNEWKGQVPKPVMQRRIESRLSDREVGVINLFLRTISKGQHHNVWDCVGIGLHYFRRL